VASPRVLAHRGARRRAPENTLEAFRLALELGADGVELDVHRTADGELVVHHDATARSLGVLATRGFEEIRDARPDVPTLNEVLDACRGAWVNIEIKNDRRDADFDPDERAADLVVALLDRRGRGDEVIVSSFRLASIDRVRSLDGSVATGLLPEAGLSLRAVVELSAERGHTAVHPYFPLPFLSLPFGGALPFGGGGKRSRLGPATARAHDLGLQVNVCTLNQPRTIRRAAALGVDAIMTDVPDVALRALGR
jgi:glycerophosphoryl diester phosphodiesterase